MSERVEEIRRTVELILDLACMPTEPYEKRRERVGKVFTDALATLTAENERLRALAYIGECQFDDLTWKSRCDELVTDLRSAEARVAALEAALRAVAFRWESDGAACWCPTGLSHSRSCLQARAALARPTPTPGEESPNSDPARALRERGYRRVNKPEPPTPCGVRGCTLPRAHGAEPHSWEHPTHDAPMYEPEPPTPGDGAGR